MVIDEVNDQRPYCCGTDNGVHESEVDFRIEGDGNPRRRSHQPSA